MPRISQLPLRHGAVVEVGYNSHLIDMTSRKFWTPRDPVTPLADVIHEDDPDFALNIFLKDLTDLYNKFIFSIKDGTLVGPNNIPIPIRDRNGIEHLANTIEATDISVNPLYYNAMGIHNLGHQLLGLSMDPQFIARLPTGVMSDTAVTMRDPVFYTFHAMIDNLFDKYKRTLAPYQLYDGEFPLVWEGVAINRLEIVPNLRDGHSNNIRTFWTTRRFPLESGIDHSIHDGDVKADICALHLNHETFTYRIAVTVNPCVNVQSLSGQGMMRIFMAPRYDEYGRRFPLKVQRRLMFQLDVFPVKLTNGKNVIYRSSKDSSLTKPWLRGLREQIYGTGKTDPMSADSCGCGWPEHLMIPKGSPQGMEYDLFAMITNYDEDAVRDSIEDLKIQEPCNSPYLFCGIPWRNYPDARPMGYPFDRPVFKIPVNCNVQTMFPDMLCKLLRPQWYRAIDTLEEYVHAVPNMATIPVSVRHVDTII
ncbi:Phenoloxidase 3 [Orchesella cincta]|uniref:Phenoloxidase 3 n=1 Tax=Orchesella cincta TaxID=48709 RepID=A0A1D2MH98_ORCCI|nr:Phenoloxidase 3 [Orchesella cincta]